MRTDPRLQEQVYLLLNYGKGYDYRAVMEMPRGLRLWHLARLDLDARKAIQNQQRAEQAARAAARGKR